MDLLSILRLQTRPIKILSELGELILTAAPMQAILLARAGRYEWGGTERRVRWMRSIAPVATWHPCWRTTEAAVFYPSADYLAKL